MAEITMRDKTMAGFLNALENLPLLISVFTGKTTMHLRHKPTDSEENEFLTDLKMSLAANAKAVTDMLLWMLPAEIEVGKIKLNTDKDTGKIYFDDFAKELSDLLLNGATNRPLTDSRSYSGGVNNNGTPKIEFEVSDGNSKTTTEIKEFVDKLRAEFNGEYDLTIKVKL